MMKVRWKCGYLCVIFAALFIVVSGCGAGDSQKVKLRYWNGFTGPDGRTMRRLVNQFNRENPDIFVLMQRMDWSTYYNKLFVAGIGKRAPEVFIIQVYMLERFMRANFIRSIDDLLAKQTEITAEDFPPYLWSRVEKNGKHYGIPLDIHMWGMYYNKKLFREAGIVDEHGEPVPPKNRKEFLDAVRKLTRDLNGDGKPDEWGFVFTWFESNIYTFMLQWGGKFFTPDYSRCIMNCKENVEALQFCVDLIRKYKVAPPPENFDAWLGFRQGKIGLVFDGIYMLQDLRRQEDLDFGGAPLPKLGKYPAAWGSSHIMCLKAGLKGKRLQSAWRFIRFLSEHSLDWAEGGQIPARKKFRETERFRKMTVQWEFAKQIPYIKLLPRTPFISEFLTEFDLAVEKALRGSATPKEALDIATEKVNKVIARYRAMYKEALGGTGE
ncbi:ABC transporter substrate-binding protein [Candidatus Sumerlaeota bacterium]|nr:ABC transporter substrate-binding protein [Candidatus Sumerlaeota bacterium]